MWIPISISRPIPVSQPVSIGRAAKLPTMAAFSRLARISAGIFRRCCSDRWNLPVTLVLRTSQTQPAASTRLPNLRLIRDRVSEAALRALYAEARFVVVPLSDTLNASGVSTILEAGAMGKATIVSASAATDDFVIANETCLRVPCHDPVALRAAIERLLNEPETCERLGRNARRFVVEHCSRPAFATRFAAALRSFARGSQ